MNWAPVAAILDPQAFLVGNMLRVFQHALDGAGAALDDGTKALFLNTGKTAGDVARCGLALAHIAANALYQIEVNHMQSVTIDAQMVEKVLE